MGAVVLNFIYMGKTLTSTRELSVLISEDDATGQFLVQQAVNAINQEIDLNLVFSCDQLLDFLLKNTLERDLNRQQLPDLIIANYNEPFRDLKIIAEIRKREQHRNTPIYVFVNENISQTREKFLEYGVTEVFEKPPTYLALKKQIELLIGRL